MVNDDKVLWDAGKNGPISKDVTDTLLELDTTQSMGTQVELNRILFEIYNTLGKKPVEDEVIGKEVTQTQFLDWVNDNFTEYSAEMLRDTIAGKL